MSIKDITIVIASFKSDEKVVNCLNSNSKYSINQATNIWTGKANETNDLIFERENRGVNETYTIDKQFMHSSDAIALNELSSKLQEIYLKPGKLKLKDSENTQN